VSRDFCCHGDCNQGRTCPHRPATPPTRREWLFAVGALVAALVLSFILSGCGQKRVFDLTDEDGCKYSAEQWGENTNIRTAPKIGKNGKQICREVRN
jgi:hypothetical protein